MDPAGQR
jgi:hypothetical protein